MKRTSLDASQSAVLKLADGESAAVIGAPGSGKTTTLIEFVAARVAGGLATDDLLVLAPTRTTATALRDSLALRIGTPTAGPLARTPHSVAFNIVRDAHPDDEVTLLTGAEQDRIIADLLDGEMVDGRGTRWPDRLSPAVRRLSGFRTELRDLIMRAAEYGIGPDRLRALGHSHAQVEWVAAAEFLTTFLDVKDQSHRAQYDAAELTAYAARLIADGTVDTAHGALGGLASVRLVLVDDGQELTESAIGLLRGFAARGAAIVVFGDPDVAANGFRGGRADLLGDLSSVLRVPNAKRLVLEHVYRGTPELRQLVQAVTGHIGTALAGTQRRALMAPGVIDTDIRDDEIRFDRTVRLEASSRSGEVTQIAALLREHHVLREIPWSRMAVVVRSGADIAAIERGFGFADIPTGRTTFRKPLRDEPGAEALLRAAHLVTGGCALDAALARELLLSPIGRLDTVGLRRLRLALRQVELGTGGARTADELLASALSSPDLLAEIDAPAARKALRLVRLLSQARQLAESGGSIEEILWCLWDGSGLGKEWGARARGTGPIADEANRALDGCVALFAAARRFVERMPGGSARRFIREVLDSDVPEDSLAPQRSGEFVRVTTPQELIGRDVDIVVVARLQTGIWPNLRPRSSLLRIDRLIELATSPAGHATVIDSEPAVDRARVRADELRLFALAISRAQRQVVLSCTSTDDEQPSPLVGFTTKRVRFHRSRPLHARGLVGALRRELVASPSASVAAGLARLARAGVPGADPADWYGLLPPSSVAPLVDLDGDPSAVVDVSPSRIERAEESPLAWFIDQVASPPAGLAAQIGTLVHAVVEAVAARDDGDTSFDAVWRDVEARWGELQFESPWLAERERMRVRQLAEGASDYLTQAADSGIRLLESEGSFELRVGQVRLRGTIDRIERSPDGTVVIVDVKTGRSVPAKRGMAENPQLGAYQLAALGASIELGDDANVGGAKLVYLAKPTGGAKYTERAQQPFGVEEANAFGERVQAVGRMMASSTFAGPAGEVPYGSPLGRWEYRMHLVKAVSS